MNKLPKNDESEKINVILQLDEYLYIKPDFDDYNDSDYMHDSLDKALENPDLKSLYNFNSDEEIRLINEAFRRFFSLNPYKSFLHQIYWMFRVFRSAVYKE